MRFIALASCKSDTDRERFNIAYMVMISHGKLFEVAQRLKLFSYRIHKIVAILLYMKTNDVSAKHSLYNIFTPRTNTESFRRGPRYMPKQSDLRVWSALFYHLW